MGADPLEHVVRELLRPPPKLTLSEWADRHFHMAPEDGGKWRTRPYQREIMDALTDPEVERVTLMKSARIGYTKMLVALIAYHVHQDPCSLLVVQPTVEDAEGFSKKEVAGAIRDNPVLHGLVSEARARDSGNTILSKEYLGRTLWMTGANSGRGFRRIHARLALCDEVDAYPPSAGTEGDPVELAWMRTQEAAIGRKLVVGSTPLDKGLSRVEKAFAESDQRVYHVPCPECSEMQRIEWGGKDKAFGIKWPAGRPEEAYYLCRGCGARIAEDQKLWMLERGVWRAQAPFKGHAGFHLWAGYSLSPNATWSHIAGQFERVHRDPIRLKTWVNTWLGETWEERGEGLEAHWLLGRREAFVEQGGKRVIPQAASVLTAGVDLQDDRLEVKVDAWGPGEECWTPEYHVLHGDPAAQSVWEELEALLLAPRRHQSGVEMFVRAVGLDTGGHHTQQAYSYTRPRFRRTLPDGSRQFVFAMKGMAGARRTIWPPSASLSNIGRVRLFLIGVDAAKETIYARLRVSAPGPGYVHFPTTFDPEFFEQLTAEKVVTKYDKNFPRRVWVKKEASGRNEVLDCAVLSYAALHGFYAFGGRLDREAARLVRKGVEERAVPIVDAGPPRGEPFANPSPPAEASSTPSPRSYRRGVIRSRWMQGR